MGISTNSRETPFPEVEDVVPIINHFTNQAQHHQHDTDKDTRSFQLEQLINNFQTIYHQIYLPCPYLLPTLNYFSKRKLSPTREQCF